MTTQQALGAPVGPRIVSPLTESPHAVQAALQSALNVLGDDLGDKLRSSARALWGPQWDRELQELRRPEHIDLRDAQFLLKEATRSDGPLGARADPLETAPGSV